MEKIIRSLSNFIIEHNFKKVGKNKFINEENPNIIKVIEFQKYSFNASFTIKVRIALPEVYTLALEKEHDIKKDDGVINVNLGEIIHEFKGKIINKSFEITDSEDLLIDLYELFQNKVFPFTNSFNSYSDILNFVDNNRLVAVTIVMKMQIEKLRELV